jgi:hypothetical protein
MRNVDWIVIALTVAYVLLVAFAFLDYSGLMLAAWMIGVHRAISPFTSVRSASCPRLHVSGMLLPSSSRRPRTTPSSRAMSSASASLSRTGLGVALGANRANQADAWNSGSPASSVVGTPGRAALRVGPVMA